MNLEVGDPNWAPDTKSPIEQRSEELRPASRNWAPNDDYGLGMS